MNDWDRNNLEFLLHASPEVIKDWESKVTADDIAYAHELLNQFAVELKEQAQALRIEAELSLLQEYNEANAILDRISGKGV
jgi:hypothetical protein